jgi:1,4-alpha-glucan branching enzyme
VASEIDPKNPDSWFAKKRSTLAAALVFTAPGIPMLFQGQEFLEEGWFQDTVPLDWQKSEDFSGLVLLYRDLIQLRLNRSGHTRGLTGSGLNTFHQNQADNVIAFHRWHQGGDGDDVVVVINLSHQQHNDYTLGFPSAGRWELRFNSDWNGYSGDFGNHPCNAADAIEQIAADGDHERRDGFPAQAKVSIGAYSAIIFSKNC